MMRHGRMIVLVTIAVGCLALASGLSAQEQANIVTANTGVSVQVILVLVGLALTAVIASVGGLLSNARALQKLSDHIENGTIHRTQEELGAAFVRRETCEERHGRQRDAAS